ncbi:MAG: hypothetical protein P1U74_01770 [Legionellaceae bacterium]|nr:hypothetical protein [Legionellaceae bacterium]
MSTPLLSNKKFTYQLSLGAVIFAYIAIYFIFLCNTHFLPYVFDNNETFSSLIHAQNLFHFGLKDSLGLTDEAYGLIKEAHPYVYTHQGNFPRFYSFLLYYLGIRSAEWQIFVSTFTIGLAGILFCYHYFCKHVSTLFAAIFCLLLMTDYIMFAQWHINTWRVWHLFFFFSSFLCCHGLNDQKWKLYIPISILNFACLYYTEIVYASFVFFSASIYLLLFPSCTLKRKLFNVFIISLGVLLSIVVLVEQNIIYLGWDNFLEDMSYTFTARNNVLSWEETSKVKDFYYSHKIVFWDNFNIYEHIRDPLVIIQTWYRYCLLPYGPFINLSAFITILGSFLSYLTLKFEQKSNSRFMKLVQQPNSIRTFVISTSCVAGLFFLEYIMRPSTWNGRFGHVSLLTVSFTILICLSSALFIYKNSNNLCLSKTRSFLKFTLMSPASLIIFFALSALLNIIFLSQVIHPMQWNVSFIYRAALALLIGCITFRISLYLLRFFFKNNKTLRGYSNVVLKSKSVFTFITTIAFIISLAFLTFVSFPITWSRPQISTIFQGMQLNIIILFVLLFVIKFTNQELDKNKLANKNILLILYFFFTIILSYCMYYLDGFSGPIATYIQLHTVKALSQPSVMLFILGVILFISNPLTYSSHQPSENNAVLITFKKLLPFLCATALGFLCVYMVFPGYVRSGYLWRYCCFSVFAHISIYAWLFYVISMRAFNIKINGLKNTATLAKEYFISALALLLLLTFSYLWLDLQWLYIKEFPPGDFNFVKLLKNKPFYKKSIVANTYAAPFSYVTQSWAYSDPVFGQNDGNIIKDPTNVHFNRDLRYMWVADASQNKDYLTQDYFVCWQSYYSFDLLGFPKPKCYDFPLIQLVRNAKNVDFILEEVEHDQSGRDKWSIVALKKPSAPKDKDESKNNNSHELHSQQKNMCYMKSYS